MTLKNPKAKGNRNERKVIKYLELTGWICIRSAGSLGMFDLLAFHPKIPFVRCIQVKSNRNAPKEEKEAIEKIQLPFNFTKEIWIIHDYEEMPEIHYVENAQNQPHNLEDLEILEEYLNIRKRRYTEERQG